MNDAVLVKLDSAQQALSQCKTAMEAKQVADVAEAARIYLQRTNASAETVNRATEIRVLAEKQMGEFLKAMPKNEGGDPVCHANRVGEPSTLRSLGITKEQSSRAQKLADIPMTEIKERIAVAKVNGGRLSTAAVLRDGSRPLRAERWTMPSQAMFVARGAITSLSKIDRKDKEWRKGIMLVARWCKIQLNQNTK